MARIFLFYLSLMWVPSIAQDTLKITVRQADSLFLSHSFYLLASSMNIEASRAQVLQARIYPNPVLSGDINVYATDPERWLNAGPHGQKTLQVEQLIVIGGKRKAEIEIAKANVAIAELEFQNLVRQLKFRLHSDLFALGQQQFLLQKYNSQLALLDDIVVAYEAQAERGNIPYKDVVRLKGAYLKLANDRAELFKPYYQAQANVQTLLQVDHPVEFQFTEDDIRRYIRKAERDELVDLALNNRPDLLLVEKDRDLASLYLDYQKKLAIPDISFFANYDQRGGAFNNQINAGAALPLPLWNRNQGNVRSARFRVREQEYRVESVRREIASSVQSSLSFYSQTVSEYEKASRLYNEDFEITLRGISENFQKRNVSILEFVDFFEAYNEVLTELARIRVQLVESGEELNLLIGKEIF